MVTGREGRLRYFYGSVGVRTRQNPGLRDAILFFPQLCEFLCDFSAYTLLFLGLLWSFQKNDFSKTFGLNKPKKINFGKWNSQKVQNHFFQLFMENRQTINFFEFFSKSRTNSWNFEGVSVKNG